MPRSEDRKPIYEVIAKLAIERDCTLLTADSDFHSIARCVRLKLAPRVS